MVAIGVSGSSAPLLSCFCPPFVQSKFLNAFWLVRNRGWA